MIPVATTTITILATTGDPYEESAPTVVASGIRAHIGQPGGSEIRGGGSQSDVSDKLDADPCTLDHTMQVRDDTTGVVFDVVWVRDRRGLGLDHIEAGLRQVVGHARGAV